MTHIPLIVNLTAGSLAGATSVIFTYPLDLVRVRMAVSVKKQFTGILHCIRTAIANDGALGLFRGMSPTLMVRNLSHKDALDAFL